MKIVYIAGPYRSNGRTNVDINIQFARRAAITLAREGGIGFYSPHLNSAHFEDYVYEDSFEPMSIDEFFLAHGIHMLSFCDALVLIPGWRQSEGTLKEVEWWKCNKPNCPIFEMTIYDTIPDGLLEWYFDDEKDNA